MIIASRVTTSFLFLLFNLVIDNNEIAINVNTNANAATMQNNDTMMYTNEEMPSNVHDKNNERTISSSSSEQLIPKEKQTGNGLSFLYSHFSYVVN